MKLNKDEFIWTKMTKVRKTERRNDKKTEREIEVMTKRHNDRKTESPCHESWLVKMDDIINGGLKINFNKYSHQLSKSDVQTSNKYITTNRMSN